MTSKVSLPKKKDWKPGRFQIGLFMRTNKGSVINLTVEQATPAMCALFSQMVQEASKNPSDGEGRSFDEWLKVWNDRFDKREIERSAAGAPVTPSAP